MNPRDLALNVISYTLKVPTSKLTDDAVLADLAADSIALFELLTNFEKVLGQSVKYEDVVNIETVGEVVAYVSTFPMVSLNPVALPGLEPTA